MLLVGEECVQHYPIWDGADIRGEAIKGYFFYYLEGKSVFVM